MVLPIIAPSVVGIGLFGFTLSWDEVGTLEPGHRRDQNTLPLELQGLTTTVTKPEIYALGTVTDGGVLRRHPRLAPARPHPAQTPGARPRAGGGAVARAVVTRA